MWWEDGFDPLGDVAATDGSSGGRFVDAFVDALEAHARFGGVGRIIWPRAARHRSLGQEVRARLRSGGAIRA